MSRKPNLQVGGLYYIKIKKDYGYDLSNAIEYVAKIIALSSLNDPQRICAEVEVLASNCSDGWPMGSDCWKTRLSIELRDRHRLDRQSQYYWHKAIHVTLGHATYAWMRNVVVQKYNPKKLPLYISWAYNEWAIQELKEGTNGNRNTAPHANELALVNQ